MVNGTSHRAYDSDTQGLSNHSQTKTSTKRIVLGKGRTHSLSAVEGRARGLSAAERLGIKSPPPTAKSFDLKGRALIPDGIIREPTACCY